MNIPIEIFVPKVARIPNVGEKVITPDGHECRVTKVTERDGYWVLVGTVLNHADGGQNIRSACWMWRLEE